MYVCVHRFKSLYQTLRGMKTEIEHTQHLLQRVKVEVQRQFEEWWQAQAQVGNVQVCRTSLPPSFPPRAHTHIHMHTHTYTHTHTHSHKTLLYVIISSCGCVCVCCTVHMYMYVQVRPPKSSQTAWRTPTSPHHHPSPDSHHHPSPDSHHHPSQKSHSTSTSSLPPPTTFSPFIGRSQRITKLAAPFSDPGHHKAAADANISEQSRRNLPQLTTSLGSVSPLPPPSSSHPHTPTPPLPTSTHPHTPSKR